MGRKLKQTIVMTVLLLMTAVFSLPVAAASGKSHGSLQILYKDEETPIPDAVFRGYLVATPDNKGGYTVGERFAESGVTFSGQMDNADWMDAAKQMLDFVEQNNISPDVEGVTDASGLLTFSDLAPGLYLIGGDQIQIDDSTYTPQPFWVEVLSGETATAEPKFNRITEPDDGEEPPTGDLQVSKQVTGTAANVEDVFSFQVKLSGEYAVEDGKENAESITGEYGDLKFENGVAEFSLKHGESLKATDLPSGIHYEVLETNANGYSASYEGTDGVIPEDATAYAVITNRKDLPAGSNSTPSTNPPASPKGDGGSPKTGDDNMPGMWLAIAVIGMATAMTAMKKLKK